MFEERRHLECRSSNRRWTGSFERRFALADHIQVRGADLNDGMLAIELVREIPEAMKPRKIEIGGSAPEQIEGRVSDTEDV